MIWGYILSIDDPNFSKALTIVEYFFKNFFSLPQITIKGRITFVNDEFFQKMYLLALKLSK